ncbi:hypothetical protein C7B82_01780 [Stenomitos frigidus ULC18]|uniref:GerMN domain-containing protein n=1 Tax=Stenomitos frigidus ULC18 TaxID=2107698 RepID=A0A2T1EQD3_9CYAN|nr:hypothetical protein C7B82_01780 [Stenomitos frigidus ULC18]
MKTHDAYSTHRSAIVGVELLLLIAAGGGVWWTWQASTPTASNQQAAPTRTDKMPAASHPQPAPSQSQAAVSPQLTKPSASLNRPQTRDLQPESYWLKVDGQRISLVPHRIALNAAVSSEQALMEGIINLLANPTGGDRSSAIPVGTRLLSLRMAPEGIYVNLSREFSQGGGSSSMIYRVAQILYTVTSLDPTANVYLSVEGQFLNEKHPLGGEGLILRQPLTRQQFAKDFSLS